MKRKFVLFLFASCFFIRAFSAIDLVMSNGGIVPNGMTRGTSYSITVYVTNTGSTSTSTSFYVNISINTSPTYNGNQTYLTDIFVNGGIASGQTKTLTTTITIPCSYTAGTRYILDGADATNLIAESNETNNNFNFPFLNRNLNTPLPNSPSNITQTSFQANWQTIPEATSYTLLVSLNNTFTNILPGYNNLNVGNVTSRVVSGLNCNTNYYYRLQAVNLCGSSTAVTSEQIATTVACACPPQNAPTANAANNQSQTGFRANWSTASGANSYRLDVSTNSSFSAFVSGYNNLNVGNNLLQDVTGLTCNTNYYYRVRAVNSCGNTSGNSSTISTSTTVCSCPAQTAPTTSTASSQTQTSFRANWVTASGASGYRIDVSTSSTFSNYVSGYNNLDVGNNTFRDITGLTCNSTYYFRLRAYNSCGNISINSSFITTQTTACVCTPPITPTGFNATPISSSQINLNWSSVANATGYDVFLCNGTYLGYVSAPSTSYSHTGLTANTSYSYKIQAQNGGASCVSLQTSCISATTLSNTCIPPSTPTGLTATPVSTSQINLSWTSVAGATGYDIFLCNGNYLGYVAAPSISYQHIGLVANTLYSYKIHAQKGGAACISQLTNCVSATTLSPSSNPVPLTIISPMPSLPNTFIYQLALPDLLYNASIAPITCRPKYKCSEVFLFQNPQNPNNVSQIAELLPSARECFSNLQNSWDFRQRGFITGNNGIMCNTLNCSRISSVISHSQNACANKDDRYAWDVNLTSGGSKADAGLCVLAIEDGKIVAPRGVHNICIEHTNSNNQKWYSWYDNINPNANLQVGSTVLKKEHLGHIGNHIAAPHLHFGIYFRDASNKLISVNRPIAPNYSDINGDPFTVTNINGTCTGSIISGAKVYFKKEGEWFFGGYSDENGKFQIQTIPSLKVGDSIKVFANGYEPISVQIDAEDRFNLDLKFGLIKNSSNNGVFNPSFSAINNAPFFTNSIILVKVNGSNYNSYSVYKIKANEEDDEYVPISLNRSPLDTLINLPLTDTGENNIGIFYYGLDTVLLTKKFIFNPVLSNSFSVNIISDLSSLQSSLYVNRNFIKRMTRPSEVVSLEKFENILTFSKLGYQDTSFVVVNNSIINLKMKSISPEYFSGLDSNIIDFEENGKVQHWRKVTLMDSLAKCRIVIKQFEKTYSDLRLQPQSRTIDFTNTKKTIWSNIKLVAVLDQAINFSKQNTYLLKILNDVKFEKIPFTSNGADYDSLFQKLTYSYINFQNGGFVKEAISVMKKQPPIVTEVPAIFITMNDTLKLPLALFVTDPDKLKSDMLVSVNNVSVPISNFQFSIVDSFVYITTGNNFVGDVVVNLSATHDFITVTKNVQLKVLPPVSDNLLSIYPNPASSFAFADLRLTVDGRYTLVMYDMQGSLIRTIFSDKAFTRGHYIESLNLLNIPSGTYIFKLNDKPTAKFVKLTD